MRGMFLSSTAIAMSGFAYRSPADVQSSLKQRLAAKKLQKPDWYEGTDENAWDNLSSEDKQLVIDNPNDPDVLAMSGHEIEENETEEEETEETDDDNGDESSEEETERTDADRDAYADANIDEIKSLIGAGDIVLDDERRKLHGLNLSLTDEQLVRAIAMTDDDDVDQFRKNAIYVAAKSGKHVIASEEEVAEIGKAIEAAAKVVDKKAIADMEKATDDNENARRLNITMTQHVIRFFGEDGRGRKGNRFTVPVLKSTVPDDNGLHDIWYTQKTNKDGEVKDEEHSFWKEQYKLSFGKAINEKIVELSDAKSDKNNTMGETKIGQHLSRWRARRDYGNEKWLEAVGYVQKAYIVNQCDNVIVYIGDDEAQRGNEPIVVAKKTVIREGGKELVRESEARSMSIGTFLKFGTVAPITKDMTWDAFLKTAPARKKRAAQQSSDPNNTKGLAFPDITTANQFDGATAEYANACKNKELVASWLTRLHERDEDGDLVHEDAILSMFTIHRTLGRLLSAQEFVEVDQANRKQQTKAQADAVATGMGKKRKAS